MLRCAPDAEAASRLVRHSTAEMMRELGLLIVAETLLSRGGGWGEHAALPRHMGTARRSQEGRQ